jgi:dienelactone hydrolase
MLGRIFQLAATGLAALCLTQVAVAQPQQTAETRAREIVDWVLAEKYEDLYLAFDPQMRQLLPVEKMAGQIGPALKQLGRRLENAQPRITKVGGNTVVVLPVQFAPAWIDFTVSLNEAGQVTGLFMQPGQPPASAWVRPGYSKPETFTERDVTVGADEWKLPGTLTLPKADKPVAAVVLVHGSGPNDRNETILGSEPFRDLAEGLASRGIAVLRYEKRTKVYGAKMAQMKDLTVREETVDDAVRAVDLLRGQPGIDPKRVFVLGHSLGGYLLPMILEKSRKAAGGIALAGSTRPLEDLVLEQMEYLIPIQTAGSEEGKKEGQKKLDETRRAVAAIKALEPGKESSGAPSGVDAPSLVGMSAHYLLDLRGYNPPALAAGLQRPLLILQGERDYQVSMRDFANWKAALGNRKNVTLKSYPALNHLFMEGTGKSTPEEYSKPGHVSADVIDDIAGWVLAR